MRTPSLDNNSIKQSQTNLNKVSKRIDNLYEFKGIIIFFNEL